MTGGRCHGPNCTQPAVIDFCSETCQARWNRQYEAGICLVECRCPQCNEEITWQQLRAEVERTGESVFTYGPYERRPGEVEVVVSINQSAIRRAYRRLIGEESAEFPQLAPPNTQFWPFGRAFHWLFGRTS